LIPIRYILKRIRLFFIYRVLHVDDTPHRIALGVAVGVFVAWTPTMGFQMLLAVLLATLLRANKLVGIPFVWISNPVTTVPIYHWIDYHVGLTILGSQYPPPNFSKAIMVGGSWWLETWVNRIGAFWEAIWQAFMPISLGSLVVGLTCGGATYLAVRYAVIAYRRHRHRKHPHRKKLPL